MASLASQQPIADPTLIATPRESPKKCKLTHNDRSELSLHRSSHRWLPEAVNSLYGSYPDDYPSGSFLKDGDFPTTARSSAYMGLALTATRASQQPIRVLPKWLPLRESPER